MTASETGFLSRWSKLKRDNASAVATPAVPAPSQPNSPTAEGALPSAAAADDAETRTLTEVLPPIESIVPGADISAFMQTKVPDALKRQALKAMLRDPHFNVMDGLDVYIDDYTKVPDLPPDWWKDSKVMGDVLNPKKMVVNAEGNAVWEDELPPAKVDEAEKVAEGDALSSAADVATDAFPPADLDPQTLRVHAVDSLEPRLDPR